MNAIIVGGGRNSLGERIATMLASKASVFVFDKNSMSDDTEIDHQFADATSMIFYEELLRTMERVKPELVVNFVGAIDFQALDNLRLDNFKQLLHINLLPLANCARALAAYQGSTSFIQIGSNAASYPFSSMFSYCVSKAAQKQAIKIIAKEIAPRSRANMINPMAFAPNDSNMSKSQVPLIFADASEDEAVEKMVGRVPLKRLCTIDDLYSAIDYYGLQAKYVTGQVLELSGGQIL